MIKKRANTLQIVHINQSSLLKPIPFFPIPSQLPTQPFHSSPFCFKMLLHYFFYFYLSVYCHKKTRDTVCRDYTYLLMLALPKPSSSNKRKQFTLWERELSLLILEEIFGRFRISENKSKVQQILLLSSTISVHTLYYMKHST